MVHPFIAGRLDLFSVWRKKCISNTSAVPYIRFVFASVPNSGPNSLLVTDDH